MRLIISLLLLSSLLACTSVESSAEQVFKNAGDAIKPESNEIWWMSPEEEEKEEAVPESLRN